MTDFKQYNQILIIPLAALMLTLLILTFMLEPISGDLTRLGAYPESDYGWNSPQEKFERPLYNLDKTVRYTRPHDVVVVGDSFSILEFPFQWQNYFALETGYRPLTLPINKTDPDTLVNHPVFKALPPKLVILQIVERSLVSQLAPLADITLDCQPHPASPRTPLLTRSFHIAPALWQRDRSTFPLRFGESAHTLKGTFKRWYDVGIKSHFGKLPQAVRLPLNRSGLFSSREKDSILVYRNDFTKGQYDSTTLKKMKCGALKWKETIEKNGVTHFVLMVAPDKSTAYGPFIEFGDLRNVNLTKTLVKNLSIPRLDIKIRDEIRKGMQDVYLPNDTHWGTAGHKLAAKELTLFLKRRGVLQPVRKFYDYEGNNFEKESLPKAG